jgi:glycine/D-amino acid oxidase-like deaminating enzyme
MSKLSPMADPSRLPPSLWAATAEETFKGAVLEGQHSFDVCIVGGGFTGLSAALHAAEAGVSVCVLEASEPGWGASGRNGGQVIPGFKWDPDELVAKFGAEDGERLVSLAGEAPDKVFELIASTTSGVRQSAAGGYRACMRIGAGGG